MDSKAHLHSWHFAANGEWEKALCYGAVPSSPDIEKIGAWINGSPQNIAFEAIYANEHGEPCSMFGVRITPLTKSEQVKRISELLHRAPRIKTEDDFLPIYHGAFPDIPLFSDTAEALNIGIVGQWFSFGEACLWSSASPNSAPLSLDELKEASPRFIEETHNPAAIELWHTQPVDHWYKIYVSDKQANGCFQISSEKYHGAIAVLRDKIGLS